MISYAYSNMRGSGRRRKRKTGSGRKTRTGSRMELGIGSGSRMEVGLSPGSTLDVMGGGKHDMGSRDSKHRHMGHSAEVGSSYLIGDYSHGRKRSSSRPGAGGNTDAGHVGTRQYLDDPVVTRKRHNRSGVGEDNESNHNVEAAIIENDEEEDEENEKEDKKSDKYSFF